MPCILGYPVSSLTFLNQGLLWGGPLHSVLGFFSTNRMCRSLPSFPIRPHSGSAESVGRAPSSRGISRDWRLTYNNVMLALKDRWELEANEGTRALRSLVTDPLERRVYLLLVWWGLLYPFYFTIKGLKILENLCQIPWTTFFWIKSKDFLMLAYLLFWFALIEWHNSSHIVFNFLKCKLESESLKCPASVISPGLYIKSYR